MMQTRKRNVTTSLLLRIGLLDAFTSVPMPIICVVLIRAFDPQVTAVLLVLRYVLMLAWLWRLTEPMRRWEQRERALDDRELLEVDDTLHRFGQRYSVAIAIGWIAMMGSALWLGWVGFPVEQPIGLAELLLVTLVVLGQFTAVLVNALPIVQLTLIPLVTKVGAEVMQRGLVPRRARSSVATLMLMLPVGSVFALFCAVTAIAGGGRIESSRALSLEEQERRAEVSALRIRAGEPIDLEPGVELLATDELPGSLGALSPPAGEAPSEGSSAVDVRGGLITAAAPVGDDRWIVATAPLQDDILFLGIFMFLGVFVAGTVGASTSAAARMYTHQLNQLGNVSRRIVDLGEIRGVERVVPLRNDEVGKLVLDFNGMLDMLDELTTAASRVASGDLRVLLERPGELHDAFRGMLDRLHEMVVQIRSTALELASAAAEIHAITQEQEAAAEQQSASVRQVSTTVASLAASAESISGTAKGVLDNAEQTLVTTGAMLTKIGELSNQANGIGDLLQRIREIADRSDLLALNGSLEATRVGEAGRGFALVAAEMRRLAERVTATVEDVHTRVNDIKATGTGTVLAAEDGRKLAEQTATAAREISLVTGRQSRDTDQVAQTVQAVAGVVIGSATATSQTRSAAEGLKERAEALEQLTRQFQLRRTTPASEEIA